VNAPLTLPGFDPGALLPPTADARQVVLGQWFTPPWLAEEVVACVPVAGRVVLEPSAGGGNIVHAALKAGADAVIAVEIDPAMCTRLAERFASEVADGRVEIYCADFLTLDGLPAFETIVGNIPYDDGADGDHLARIADLVAGTHREIGMLLRTVVMHSGDRFNRVWSRLAITQIEPCADRIPFPPAGDEPDEAGKIDVSIFRMCDRAALPPGFVEPVRWLREPK
jgi:adenine-specific DNA methylase